MLMKCTKMHRQRGRLLASPTTYNKMIKDDCIQCKSHCKRKDYFSYGEIRFCRVQMIFLIEHIVELGEGSWPSRPYSSSYVDLPIRSRQFNDDAYFTKPTEMVAEVMSRLNRTVDGSVLMEEIHSGLTERYLLSPEARKALNYISGGRRKTLSYKEFKKGA